MIEPTPSPSKPKRRPFRRLLITLGVVSVLLTVARVTRLAEAFTFYHPIGAPDAAVPPHEDVFFTTSDGVRLHAWFMPARGWKPGDPPMPAVLHCHGNAGSLIDHAAFSEFLTSRGVGVLLFDYRGFGRSGPCRFITREPLALDTDAALAYLRTRADVAADRIGVYGYSLGGAFALDLAARNPDVRAVCTVSAFSSWPGVAGDVIPVLGPFLIPAALEPIENAAQLGPRPYLAIHGENDFIVRAYHSEKLVRAAATGGSETDLFIIPGAGHADYVLLAEPLRERVGEFFEKTLE